MSREYTATQPPVPIAASVWRRQGIRPGREGEYVHTGRQIQLGRELDYALLIEWDVAQPKGKA